MDSFQDAIDFLISENEGIDNFAKECKVSLNDVRQWRAGVVPADLRIIDKMLRNSGCEISILKLIDTSMIRNFKDAMNVLVYKHGSAENLSKTCNVSDTTISKWRHGKRIPDYNYLLLLEDLLSIAGFKVSILRLLPSRT